MVSRHQFNQIFASTFLAGDDLLLPQNENFTHLTAFFATILVNRHFPLLFLYVVPAISALMALAGVLQGKQGELPIFQKIQVLPDRFGLGLKNLNTLCIKPGYGSGTYTSHNNGIDCLAADRLYGVTCPMDMVQIPVAHRRYTLFFYIDHNEHRG
jgi:hypothetical protein